VKRQKNDAKDAEAIAEAASRPTMRFATAKTTTQQGQAMVLNWHQASIQQAERQGWARYQKWVSETCGVC
jgi:transposase